MAWINTIVCVEKFDSRKSSVNYDKTKNKVELTFLILGTDNDLLARAAIEATIPFDYLGLYLQNYDVEYRQGLVWDGTANYGIDQPKMPQGTKNPAGNQPDVHGNVPTAKFDTAGAKQKITVAKETIHKYKKAGAPDAPDFWNAIGYDGDKVEGTDIVIPKYDWEETHYFNYLAITPAFRRLLMTMTGTINTNAFRGWNSYEVLFLGASGSVKGLENWEITYRFSASPRSWISDGTALTIGTITNIEKNGWDYLWIRYTSEIDANRKVKVPQYVVINRVYDDTNFALLGIGSF